MLTDMLAHLSADAWEAGARRWRRVRDGALLVVLGLWWAPSEVEFYREEWDWEVRRG